jgi:anaerobic magnesium-protoporphyrin IX monomethyl ester cyclase
MSKPRILYVQHELYDWPRAKMWSHNFHLGLENGFATNGLDFTTLVTSWFPAAKELLEGKQFDQVWVNDIAHAFRDGGCGGYQMREQDLEWLAGLAPVRVGFVNETLQYSAEEYASNSGLYQLQEALGITAKYATHILAVDENDMAYLQSLVPARVMWMVPCMPETFIGRAETTPSIPKGLFIGMPYGARADWLQMPELQELLAKHESQDNHSIIPERFNELHAAIGSRISGDVSGLASAYTSYLWELRRLRELSFSMYLDGLKEGAAVVHLPSYCKVYNSRVYEGMAAGRPVITSRGDGRPRLNTLFDEGKDLLIYPVDDPQALSRQIRSTLDDPEHGRAIALRARDKLLRFHTTEKRVRQILDWIETGHEPNYTAADDEDVTAAEKERTSDVPGIHALPAQYDAIRRDGGLASKAKKRLALPRPRNGKLRILLISPPYARFLGMGNCRFPLSFGALGTMLSANGHDVAIYDADFDRGLIGKSEPYEYTFSSQEKIRAALQDRGHYVWKEIDRTIRGFNPDVVGITTMTSKYPMALRIAEMAKSINRDVTVVIGGHHSSIFGPKLVLDTSIDFAVIGEGEMTFLELINRLCEPRPDFSRVSGLTYADGDRTVTNSPRELLSNLDVLPIADRDLMINEGYVSENNIMASRGCPFNCSYCGAQVIWKRKVRRRSVPLITREIEYLLRRGSSRAIQFWDDTFTGDRRFIGELMPALRKFDGLTFSCITRLDVIDRETLAQLKGAGCNLILFGIESGSDEILNRIDKKMTREMIRQKTALVHAAGIPWLGFFIMGYPGETREDILATLAFMKEVNPSFAEINIFNPLPGTRIWNELEAQGLVGSDLDFSRYSQSSTDNYFTNGHMTKPEFKELALYMAREFDAHNRRHNGK